MAEEEIIKLELTTMDARAFVIFLDTQMMMVNSEIKNLNALANGKTAEEIAKILGPDDTIGEQVEFNNALLEIANRYYNQLVSRLGLDDVVNDNDR